MEMNLLHVAPAFFPAVYWGGPTTSVYELCNHLAQIPGLHLRVLTTDTSGPRSFDRLTPAQRHVSHYRGYDVHFGRKLAGVDFTPSLWWLVWRHVMWADVVHLTSVYSTTTIPTLFAARLLRKPIVWSPRGALQRWAGSRKRALKLVWDRACSWLLPRDARIHATSDAEALESIERLGSIETVVVPNGVTAPETSPVRKWLPGGLLRVLFLGRLDPKKGIENLLHAAHALGGKSISVEICGGSEPGYLKRLHELVCQLGLVDQVRFTGHVNGAQKSEAFFRSDVCVVPSYTENFALVVAESLAHGTPVVAGEGTPWQRLEEHRAGWWISNEPASLAQALEEARVADLCAMGQRGRRWMVEEFSWQSVAARMLETYRVLLLHGIENRPA